MPSNRLVNSSTLDAYLGGAQLESQLGHWPSCVCHFMGFLTPSRQVLGWYFNQATVTSFKIPSNLSIFQHSLHNDNVNKIYLKKNKLPIDTNFSNFISQHLPKDTEEIPGENLPSLFLRSTYRPLKHKTQLQCFMCSTKKITCHSSQFTIHNLSNAK